MQNRTNTLIIAAAIIVAGGLVLFGIFATRNNAAPNPADPGADSGPVMAEADFTQKPVTDADHIRGSKDAQIVLVEYSDLECPFCKQFHPILESISEKYSGSQFAWVYRQFPLASLHPKAPHEAEASECVAELGGEDAFWNYIDTIYEVTPANNGLDPAQLPVIAAQVGVDTAAFNSCLSSGKYTDVIQADYNDAVAAGGQGTPYSILILKTPLSEDKQATIEAQFAGAPAGLLKLSKDRKQIAIGGALPENIMTELIDTLLATSTAPQA